MDVEVTMADGKYVFKLSDVQSVYQRGDFLIVESATYTSRYPIIQILQVYQTN